MQVLQSHGTPGNGTNEVQTFTIGGTPTAGTFTLSYGSLVTAAITWSATNATLLSRINAALDAILGTGTVVATAGTLTAGIGTILLTFSSSRGRMLQAFTISCASSLTGTSPTVAVAVTTPGVDATHRGAAIGALCVDVDAVPPIMYQNVGTALNAPNWSAYTASTLTVANALTAHAGGGQASALALTKDVNRVTTVGTAADSVKLPAATAGKRVIVINAAAANAMNVYPSSGEVINALSADAAISVAANKRIDFVCAVDGTWNSNLTA